MEGAELRKALFELECAKQELQKATANLHIAQARVTLIRSSLGEDSPSKQEFVPFKESPTRTDTVVTSGGGGPQYKVPTQPKRGKNHALKKINVSFDCPKEKPKVNKNLENIVASVIEKIPDMNDDTIKNCMLNILRMLVLRDKVMVYDEGLTNHLFKTLYGIIQEHLGEGKGYILNPKDGDNSRFVNDYVIKGESLNWLPKDALSMSRNDTFVKMVQLYSFYKTRGLQA